jgi:DNA-binding transcriptional regulator LsrR (DeoR family)
MARAPASPATEEGERFLARVAWAYHVEGLTQGAVAERLGVTRVRVNKALAEARRTGLVRISLNTRFAPCVEAEAALKARYGLTDAFIAPGPADPDEARAVVGTALGHQLTQVLADKAVSLFGMSWGNTLNIATRHVEPMDRPDLEIVSVMGGTTRGSDVSSFEITSRLAHLCGATHSFFPAPLYAGSKESRDIIVGQDVFTQVLEKIRAVDALAMAVGDISDRSLLMRDALPADVTLQSLLRAGAVGDCLGTVLDPDGAPIDHPINERLIGIAFEDLRAIPNVILAAGGPHKVPVIRAVLSRGVVDTFVSDEATARALLGEQAPRTAGQEARAHDGDARH